MTNEMHEACCDVPEKNCHQLCSFTGPLFASFSLITCLVYETLVPESELKSKIYILTPPIM